MARPRMRPADGRWSLLQVAAAAGVTEKVARMCIARGLIAGDQLTAADIVPLKVAVALLRPPRPYGAGPEKPTDRRDHHAVELAQQVVADPDLREALLLVTPSDASLARNALEAASALHQGIDQSLLVLPVGRWVSSEPT